MYEDGDKIINVNVAIEKKDIDHLFPEGTSGDEMIEFFMDNQDKLLTYLTLGIENSLKLWIDTDFKK